MPNTSDIRLYETLLNCDDLVVGVVQIMRKRARQWYNDDIGMLYSVYSYGPMIYLNTKYPKSKHKGT